MTPFGGIMIWCFAPRSLLLRWIKTQCHEKNDNHFDLPAPHDCLHPLRHHEGESPQSLPAEDRREGFVFPLGVIRDGVNYYCCPAQKLKDFVSADAPETADYYLLKYTL